MAKDDPKKPDPKKGSNIPTVLGVPAIPDPRIEPKVEAKPAKEPAKPPVPSKPPVPQRKAPEVEADALELVEDPPKAAPPSTRPRVPSESDAPFEPALGSASPLDAVKKKWKELREGPRPRFIAVLAIAGVVGVIFLGVLLRLAFGTKDGDDTSTPVASASVSASGSGPAPVTTVAPTLATTAAPPPKDVTCTLGGSAHVVSSRAIVSVGIDVVGIDTQVAVGFAASAKEGSFAALDPKTATTAKITKVAAEGNVARIASRSPITSSWVSTDANALRPIGDWDVGGSNGELVWAKHGTKDTKTLWKLESDGAAEALRGVASGDAVVVAYRHAGAIWVGKGSDTASTPFKVPGLGQVGSPSIAKSGDHVLVAWADHADASQPWGLRIVTWAPGGEPKPAVSFAVPPGGPGANAMAPSVAALANGFLLLWTEGPTNAQQVRAQVLRVDGSSVGAPIRISPDGIHAGQAQAAILGDGRGIVAFLADAGKAFELRATTMKCD